MKTRMNIAALASALAIASISGSALADQPVNVAKGATIEADAHVITPVIADFNADGVVDMLDIYAYLAAWFAGKPNADMDGDKYLTGLDVLTYLNIWFNYFPSSK
jgi:hypothetical protein